MKLTPTQLEAFDRDGYLFFPRTFSAEEIKALTDEVPSLYAQHRPENVRERAATPCARTSPPTCTARPSRGSRVIPG